MNERSSGADRGTDHTSLERRVAKLAGERGALFDKSGASFGLTAADQQRLTAIERELDECFLARRQHRAVRDANRFERENPFVRRTVAARPKS